MTTVQNKSAAPILNQNLKQVMPKAVSKNQAANIEKTKTEISSQAKDLNSISASTIPNATEAAVKASEIAKDLPQVPVLPIIVPKEAKKLQEKLDNKPILKTPHKTVPIKKPAVVFIEGFSAFGISNGDGIKDMADNFPDAKRFSWDEKEKIIEEIKKHSAEQPVVLVGHSFGGDSAVEIANELNSAKNGFRSIDLLISIDAVGFNHSIMPMNVKRNLNFFGEGVLPFLHGNPTVARNTDYTEIVNELRSELHSKMEDNPEVQYKIFENINEVIHTKDDLKHLEQLIVTVLAQNSGNS